MQFPAHCEDTAFDGGDNLAEKSEVAGSIPVVPATILLQSRKR
jgi:hypothetical protein